MLENQLNRASGLVFHTEIENDVKVNKNCLFCCAGRRANADRFLILLKKRKLLIAVDNSHVPEARGDEWHNSHKSYALMNCGSNTLCSTLTQHSPI